MIDKDKLTSLKIVNYQASGETSKLMKVDPYGRNDLEIDYSLVGADDPALNYYSQGEWAMKVMKP